MSRTAAAPAMKSNAAKRRKPSPVGGKKPPPLASARRAGLRYQSDAKPGIRREVGALGFRYRDPRGRLIRAAAELKRIRALAVPPAWTDVWIAPDRRSHLQATGRDARGRKQYRYHADWRVCRDETKFDRMEAFAAALPKIRARTASDLVGPGLSREKVLAAVVQLLEKSLIRVGNEEYARTNQSFGLTTMRDRHVDVEGGTLRFQFRGKSGIRHSVDVSDQRLARIVKQCRDLPGQELFQYRDDRGRVQDITSGDVNAYVKAVSGDDFTAKDFRTWAGTVLALEALRSFETADTLAQAKKNLLTAIDAVAKLLGNTRSVCRKSYIHPAIVDRYMSGSMHACLGRRAVRTGAARKLKAHEVAVLTVLRAGGGRKAA